MEHVCYVKHHNWLNSFIFEVDTPPQMSVWQSRIEIKYSIAYFERITKFNAL